MRSDVKFRAGRHLIPGNIEQLTEDTLKLTFGYNKELISEVKSFAGARWNPEGKFWTISNNKRNKFQLEYLTGGNPYANYDSPLLPYSSQRPLKKHQIDLVRHGITYKQTILAAEMGCIDGNAIVHCSRDGKFFDVTLDELYCCYGLLDVIPTFIYSLCGEEFGWSRIKNVLHQGIRNVVQVGLVVGKQLVLTPDHEVLMSDGTFKEICSCKVGDLIQCNVNGARPFHIAITNIKYAGKCDVFDVVCEDPYRNFVANGIVVHNCGKSLSAIEIIEHVNPKEAFWVAPKSALRSVELELEKWNCNANIELMTYEGLKTRISNWEKDRIAPQVVIFDESSRVKNHTTQRSQSAQQLADGIREDWSRQAYVVLMSGTPAPKSPADWWSQCEIACPGFLKEGNVEKFKRRLGLIVEKESIQGGVYPHLVTWLDDDNKCVKCGNFRDNEFHNSEMLVFGGEYHSFVKSTNEVKLLYERMAGLVTVVLKKDCLDLPDKIYEIIRLKPSPETLRAASIIKARSSTVIGAMVLLRELSDGFQYDEEETGTKTCELCLGACEVPMHTLCPTTQIEITSENIEDYNSNFGYGYEIGDIHEIPRSTVDYGESEDMEITSCPHCGGSGETVTYKRAVTPIHTPKIDAVKELLDKYDDVGRTVFFAGFTGSIDRVVETVLEMKWEVIRVDGRGWWHSGGLTKPTDMLKRFQGKEDRISFVAQTSSAGMGLTLTASPMICYYSNDFNPESRAQSEDRCHRMGMDLNRGCTIYDLIHLSTDELVLSTLKKNLRLQSMSLGEI